MARTEKKALQKTAPEATSALSSVLIVNRGEIACRIIRTCRRMGIRAYVVHSEADTGSLATRLADRALCIGGPETRDSYLNISAILSAAKELQVSAVHPGYGFLSENADFARQVRAAGMHFIGPTPEAMHAVGDKLSAKRAATAAKVPMAPTVEVNASDKKALNEITRVVGFPLIVKAAGGGGGRGMRKVFNPSELDSAIQSASREAENFFKNPTVFCEKLIQNARHIEVQILGDLHGNVVALSDRDCTMQRNHQKVLEEAPAPNLSPTLRHSIHDAAVRLMKQAHYTNAGTVEFLLDREGNFYFLEVNSRLQVEHPVTEAVLGIDLVKAQIEVAQGMRIEEILPMRLEPIGHAIEARLCAECPEENFAPSIGMLSRVSFPSTAHIATGATVRVDTGVEAGSIVSHYYDSLIAKLIVHAPSRERARAGLQDALARTHIEGLRTNRRFLQVLLATSEFENVSHDIQAALPLFEHRVSDSQEPVCAAVALLCHEMFFTHCGPWSHHIGFRLHGNWTLSRRVRVNDESIAVVLSNCVMVSNATSHTLSLRCTSRRSEAEQIVDMIVETQGDELLIRAGTHLYRFVCYSNQRESWVHGVDTSYKVVLVREHLKHHSDEATQHAGEIAAHLPGKIIDVKVRVGDKVEMGNVLVILESMKMEHRIEAPIAATVTRIDATPGQVVQSGHILAILEAVP